MLITKEAKAIKEYLYEKCNVVFFIEFTFSKFVEDTSSILTDEEFQKCYNFLVADRYIDDKRQSFDKEYNGFRCTVLPKLIYEKESSLS